MKKARHFHQSFARELGKCAARGVAFAAGGLFLFFVNLALRHVG